MLPTLDRMGFGAVILDSSGEVLGRNAQADRVLGAGLPQNGHGSAEWSRTALEALLSRADRPLRRSEETWLTVPRPGRAPLVIQAIPIGDEESGGPHTMLVLIDLTDRPAPSIGTLQCLFSLSPAEAKLALEVGMGKSLPMVREETGLSNNTLRTQLAAVFTKTGTRRQSELVALIARVAILP